jgi:uncharacterized membrane protein HdeD (DUF308 family)
VTGIISVLAGVAMFFLGGQGVAIIMIVIGAVALALAVVQLVGAIAVGRVSR